jgi:hypothetical protein
MFTTCASQVVRSAPFQLLEVAQTKKLVAMLTRLVQPDGGA